MRDVHSNVLQWDHIKWRLVVAAGCLISSLGVATFGRQSVDYPFLLFINRAAGSVLLDDITHALMLLPLVKGVALMAGIWFIWFDAANPESRAAIVAGVIAASFAGLCSRALQLALPTHLRPLHDKGISFVVPHGVDPNILNHWASFPSDTAALLFGLAMVIAIIRPTVGIAALALAVADALSRVFGGLHSLSDITGGGSLGVAMVCASQHPAIRRSCLVFVRWSTERAGVFYASAFVVSYEVATLFEDIRGIGSGLVTLILKF